MLRCIAVVLALQGAAWAEPPASPDEEVCACCPPASLESPPSRGREIKAVVRDVSLTWLNRKGSFEPKTYGLQLDEHWQDAAPDRNVVVFLHGYNSGSGANAALLDPIRESGAPCGVFAYPNDQSIAESARSLSADLKRFAEQHPDRRVSLLAYSMGGLVARGAIENADLDPHNVSQLIMVAPPSHGSALARLAVGADIWEHCVRNGCRGTAEYLFRSLEDGFGEADDDLLPESAFLASLNALPRNPEVRYTVFLGTGGRLSEEQLAAVQDAIDEATTYNFATRYLGRQLDAFVERVNDSLVPGDGAVSVERGQLEGVEDTVLLPFDHLSVLDDPQQAAVQSLQAAILERLVAQP